MSDFSTKLRDIIEEKGISQSWLARKVGTTEATISRYICGYHKPNLDIVVRICQVLDVSMDYLMDLSIAKEPYKAPEQDVAILCNAYRRADIDHQKIAWASLDLFLTDDEKNTIRNLLALPERTSSMKSSQQNVTEKPERQTRQGRKPKN